MRRWSAVYHSVTGEALAEPFPADELQRGAEEGLGLLFDLHHQRLYRLARRLTRSADEARDLVQETFLRAIQAAESIPAGASREEAWLVRVLINICRDGWRRSAVRKRLEPMRLAQADVEPSTQEEQYVARAMIWRGLDALPPRRRAVLVLYEIEGTTIPAIAALLGVTPITVRWHLSRGRRDLARAIRRLEGREGQERQEG